MFVWVITYLYDGMVTDQEAVDSYDKAKKCFDDYTQKYDPEYVAELECDGLLTIHDDESMYFQDKEDRHTPEILVKKIKIE